MKSRGDELVAAVLAHLPELQQPRGGCSSRPRIQPLGCIEPSLNFSGLIMARIAHEIVHSDSALRAMLVQTANSCRIGLPLLTAVNSFLAGPTIDSHLANVFEARVVTAAGFFSQTIKF